MSGRSQTILNPNKLSDKVAKAIATLGTRKATYTAQMASGRILHEALILEDSKASADEMIAATLELAVILKADDADIIPGHAANGMRAHLAKIGDLKAKPKPKPAKKAASPPTDPDTIPVQQLSTKKRRFSGLRQRWAKLRG